MPLARNFIATAGILALSASCTTRDPTKTSAPSATSNPVAPSPAPVPAPAPVATRLSISGNAVLTTIGETSQLTATATLTDGSTKDVTGDGRWLSNDTRVLTVSSTGLMAVVAFGSTVVSFSYQSRAGGLNVIATPAGTFVITGRVREPGGGPLVGLAVLDIMSGRSGTTNGDGIFSLGELPRLQARLRIAKDGYETLEKDVTQPNVDLPVQRVVRLTVGETVKPDALAPNDLSYTVGGTRCDDCRMIRVVVPQPGTVHVHVTWSVNASLSLFAEGQVVPGVSGALTADVPVSAAHEILMYLGTEPPNAVRSHTPFTFETSFR